ncbi:MAG TPA: hypothetical protein VGZ52_02760 [Acidimicrobiales bacterium]|jgi:hypothetical protein|nr:hypothetical protein [Acidimicrobiales bacterium]
MKRFGATAAAAALLVLTACSSDSKSGAAGSSADPAGPSASPGSELAKGPPLPSKGPGGSGCAPSGDAATLPDGWWAGQVTNASGLSIDFDLECVFVGAGANSAAAQDGRPTPVHNDFYVRNQNPKTFHETFSSRTGPASCVADAATPFACTVGDILNVYGNPNGAAKVKGQTVFAFPQLWLHVSGGVPDYAYMQFTR